jgi:hypothetical protein
MSQGAAQNLHRAGLLPDYMFDLETGKILEKYKNGMQNVLLPPGALKDQAEFQQDPYRWIQDVFGPAVTHLDAGDRAALQTEMLGAIYADIGRVPGARLAAEALFQPGYLARQLTGLGSIPGLTESLADVRGDPTNISGGFVNAFDALMAQLGSDAMPRATAALNEFTAGLNHFTDWAKEHPKEGALLPETGAALGAGGVAGLLYGGVLPILGKMLGIGGRTGGPAIAEEGGAALFGESAVAAGGPPAWLVALMAAAVAEAIATGAGSGSNPRNPHAPPAPTGAPGDPLHVKVVNPSAPSTAAGTQMPTAPTSHLPGQSMPMPGQTGNYR